jgi:hypothetical protein
MELDSYRQNCPLKRYDFASQAAAVVLHLWLRACLSALYTILRETFGKRRVRLNDDQRGRLAEKGKTLGPRLLASGLLLPLPVGEALCGAIAGMSISNRISA